MTANQGYEQEHRELEEWFARYDALAEQGDAAAVEAMAAMALFPLNLVTDDGDAAPGSGYAGQWDRETYIRTMTQVMGGGGSEGEGGDVGFASERTPQFLSRSLAVVRTDATMTAGGRTTRMRYTDILVKQDGDWYFQTMVQSGWAAAMRSADAAPETAPETAPGGTGG